MRLVYPAESHDIRCHPILTTFVNVQCLFPCSATLHCVAGGLECLQETSGALPDLPGPKQVRKLSVPMFLPTAAKAISPDQPDTQDNAALRLCNPYVTDCRPDQSSAAGACRAKAMQAPGPLQGCCLPLSQAPTSTNRVLSCGAPGAVQRVLRGWRSQRQGTAGGLRSGAGQPQCCAGFGTHCFSAYKSRSSSRITGAHNVWHCALCITLQQGAAWVLEKPNTQQRSITCQDKDAW